jgi:hypothetical protein
MVMVIAAGFEDNPPWYHRVAGVGMILAVVRASPTLVLHAQPKLTSSLFLCRF